MRRPLGAEIKSHGALFWTSWPHLMAPNLMTPTYLFNQSFPSQISFILIHSMPKNIILEGIGYGELTRC